MLESLKELFLDYEITQNEYEQSICSTNKVWSGKRQAIYANGVVIGKCREHDEKTLEVINGNVSNDELKRLLKKYYEVEKEKLIQLENLDIIQQLKLKHTEEGLSDLEELSLHDWISKYETMFRDLLPELSEREFIGAIYIQYAFKEYMENKKHYLNPEQNNIENIYYGSFDKASQFNKYGLLPIDKDRELLCIAPPRFYDKTKNKTIYLKNIPLDLVNKLAELLDKGFIKELAVRVSNYDIFDGRNDRGILLEELERGRKFSFSNLGNFDVARLYSKDYEDCLWVITDSENITFEELCKDFYIHEEKIVTQVIHLQYKLIDKKAYITHLDHEYIFYSIDEFDKRKSDKNQKGSARPRMKTFKIDNSYIPFELSVTTICKDLQGNEVLFIYYILDCYFQHKELLKEYFQLVID